MKPSTHKLFTSPFSRPLLFSALCLLLACLLIRASGGGAALKGNPSPTELYLDLEVLKDLDHGDVQSAGRAVANDAIARIIEILAGLQSTTNAADLVREPGLRAAARYWGGKPLPANLPNYLGSDEVSNEVYSALAKVHAEILKAPRRKGDQHPNAKK